MIWPYDADEVLALVRRIAREAFPNDPTGEPSFLARGSNNAVYLLPVGGRTVVVRVTGEWREHTVARERWCLAESARAGIPGPVALASGRVERLPYLALNHLPGASGADDRAVWRTLGTYAARINAIEAGPGPVTFEGRAIYPDARAAWRATVDRILIEWGDTEPLEEVRPLLVAMRDRELAFGMSHGDLAPRNTIVGPDGTVFLIDWCCSAFGPVPHVDLHHALRGRDPGDAGIRAYLEGFGLSRGAFAGLLPEVRAYGLIHAMEDVLWARGERPDLVPDRMARVAEALDLVRAAR